MTADSTIFAGLELSSGRRPVTFAGLDGELNVRVLENWSGSDLFSWLQEYKNCALAVDVPSTKSGQKIYAEVRARLLKAGFKPFSRKSFPRQLIETSVQDCFRAWSGHRLLARRALEGRLQRSAVLYEQGLQITDPVDIFEEITRYKLVQGILPLDRLPSSKELDALAAAYLAWMSLNRPGQIVPQGEYVLPAEE